jgi:hypothetical protein
VQTLNKLKRRIAEQDGESSRHPRYCPDLAPSEVHLFGSLKDSCRGRRFADNDELKHGAREELRLFSKEFCATDIQRLM